VAFAAAFASEFFAGVPEGPKTLIIIAVVMAIVLGFVASPAEGSN
jgi:hypothetical protein